MLKLSTNPLISDLKNLKNLKKLKMVCPPWVRLGVSGPLAEHKSSILPETCCHMWMPLSKFNNFWHKVRILPDSCCHMVCQDRFEYPMGPQTCHGKPHVNASPQIPCLLFTWQRSACHNLVFCRKYAALWTSLLTYPSIFVYLVSKSLCWAPCAICVLQAIEIIWDTWKAWVF